MKLDKKQVYFLKSHTENKLRDGYKLVVNEVDPNPSDVDSDIDEMVLDEILALKPKSVYEVGYGMGSLLLNLRRLLPKAKVGGCDTQDLNRSYGNTLFKLNNNNIQLDVIEIPYKDIGSHDVIVVSDITNDLLQYINDRCKYMVLIVDADYALNVKELHVVSREFVEDKQIVVVQTRIVVEGKPVRGLRASSIIVDEVVISDDIVGVVELKEVGIVRTTLPAEKTVDKMKKIFSSSKGKVDIIPDKKDK